MSIAATASGSVDVALRAGGRTTRFTSPIAAGKRKLRITRAMPAAQARATSATLTLTYAGDSDTRSYTVRLLAARRGAALKAKRPTIVAGRLKAQGTVTKAARGSVQIQLRFDPGDGAQRALSFKARIAKGRYSLDIRLSDDVVRQLTNARGAISSSLLFAGDAGKGIAGQSSYFELVPPKAA
jgi:hypothetical protein